MFHFRCNFHLAPEEVWEPDLGQLPSLSDPLPHPNEAQCLMSTSVPLVNLTAISLQVSNPEITEMIVTIELYTAGTLGFAPVQRGGDQV